MLESESRALPLGDTPTKNVSVYIKNILAGVAGLEPTMLESKSSALPLGDTPTWGGRWDSNPRHPDPQSGALTN